VTEIEHQHERWATMELQIQFLWAISTESICVKWCERNNVNRYSTNHYGWNMKQKSFST